jgi:hypothetical protein
MAKGKAVRLKVERFCQCGARLNCTVDGEEEAGRRVLEFFREHTGLDSNGVQHARLKRWQYWKLMERRKQQAPAEAIKQQQALVASAPNKRTYKLRRA